MAALQRRGLQTRILSSEEEEKLKRDQALVSDFKQQKLEKEAQKNWDLFYKRNSTNFFKDRHWTTREFEELRSCREFEDQKLTILEAGCGVGNCLFPLLEEDPDIFAYACDFSPRAVEYVKQNPLYDTERCKVFQCDLTKDDLLEHVPPESVDVVTLIFVLSAVHPDKMHLVLQNIYKMPLCRSTAAPKDILFASFSCGNSRVYRQQSLKYLLSGPLRNSLLTSDLND
ncbi:tRNA N(3)-cytidine methyltransferase METTL6 isoform X3 [Bos taurus]|uniref:tRNA N(3)-cytidine methyltransferase METTL6 isoform X3 n=1 Tax=Bos taurus TaxID=9913 RepID=UPI000D53A145|nr:tRNA N(3)-methylcytidine methyltransferase METTL6 isoform X3 [Bos taurus]XP_059741383.1 tRNA N(3)-methylcytidine methyltransferase METTL6 isoform X3 [Bos taurus]